MPAFSLPFGGPVLPRTVNEDDVPPLISRALEDLWVQIERETLEPLFRASSGELAQVYLNVYPKFTAYYLGATLILLGFLGEPRFIRVAQRGFAAVHDLLREQGPSYIGVDAATTSLVGLEAVVRVYKAAAKRLTASHEELDKVAAEWTAVTTAYALTAFAVFVALSSPTRFPGPWENVAQLAVWSRDYAVRLYDLAKRHGLLKPSAPDGEIPKTSSEEDLLLADAGLEEYRQLLPPEDAGSSAR